MKGKAQEPPKPFEPKRTIESVQHQFSSAELKQLGIDLAHATREAIRIENDKAGLFSKVGSFLNVCMMQTA